jgi:hypothetical protein
MLLCCDVINLVRKKHKNLGIQRSLSSKRVSITRSSQSGTFTMLSHEKGKTNSFYYERDTTKKQVHLAALGTDFKPSGRLSRKGSVDLGGTQKSVKKSLSVLSDRSRSEIAERLTGSLIMPNRHHRCKVDDLSASKEGIQTQPEPEAQ